MKYWTAFSRVEEKCFIDVYMHNVLWIQLKLRAKPSILGVQSLISDSLAKTGEVYCDQ